MKRMVVLWVITVLSILVVSVGFAYAQSAEEQMQQALAVLQSADNYANVAALKALNEAEALLADEANADLFDADVRNQVAEYRRCYERDSLLLELADRVRQGDHVRVATGDVRQYETEQWQQIADWCDQCRQDIAQQGASVASMRATLDALFVQIAALPTRDDVRAQWSALLAEVVCEHQQLLFDKVAAYRAAFGAPTITDYPLYIGGTGETSIEAFEAFVSQNVQDGTVILQSFSDALLDIQALGYYATRQQMQQQWAAFDAAVKEAIVVIPQQQLDLLAAKTTALAVLQQQVQSDAVAALSAEEQARVALFPSQLQEDMQSLTTVAEVQAALNWYLAQIPDPPAPSRTVNPMIWAIVAVSALSVLLFVLYFILRRRQPAASDVHKGARVLAELEAMAQSKRQQQADQEAMPTDGADTSSLLQNDNSAEERLADDTTQNGADSSFDAPTVDDDNPNGGTTV